MKKVQPSLLSNFPVLRDDEHLYCSEEGFQYITQIHDLKDPHKHFNWTTDVKMELPIIMKKRGLGSLEPKTLIDCYNRILEIMPNSPSLSFKVKGKWQTLTFRQVYDASLNFGRALIAVGVAKQRCINIIGINSPEWFISFYGSVFAFDFPVGVYTTNQTESCQYIADNSECEVVLCEGQEHLRKYLPIWNKLPLLRCIVVYGEYSQQQFNDDVKNYPERKNSIIMWNDFLKLGEEQGKKVASQQPSTITTIVASENPKKLDVIDNIEGRMKQIRPGHCCTIVYTSGTTGMPKGVMLSHDNYTWTGQAITKYFKLNNPGQQPRILSYLPLSHSLAQISDIFGNIVQSAHIFFADATAFKGALTEFMRYARPTYFVAVPRVWEKIEEGIKLQGAKNSNWLKSKIVTWAKAKGAAGTFAEYHKNAETPAMWGMAKKLFFSKVKDALGLDQCYSIVFGGAPLSMQTRQFFLSLNINILNGYGMSESAGPECAQVPQNFDKFDDNYFHSCGQPLEGTDLIIFKPNAQGEGEICYRGRNRFMGYYKLEKETRKTLDEQGFIHTGDLGVLDPRGNLRITGRIKELIITAGGENVAPILIENVIKEELKSIISNCMVIGDQKKYLSVFLTLKFDPLPNGSPSKQLSKDVLDVFKSIGSSAKNVGEVLACDKIRKYVDAAMKRVNTKSISRAQQIQKWTFLETDFSIEGGELTPTLKLKRNVALAKYQAIADSLYLDAKL